MNIFIFGVSPGSIYVIDKFRAAGYTVDHVHSHSGLYSSNDVRKLVISSISNNRYDLVFPTIFKNQQWPELQELVKTNNCHALLPSTLASRLESNKLYSKKFLQDLEIPTAKLLTQIPKTTPFVAKSDIDLQGLQTIIATGGEWPNHIIEEYLTGPEYSYHALLNNNGWKYLGSARDYKRVGDGDTGHNTIGMGSYSLKDRVDSIVHEYMDKIYNKLKQLGIEYTGVMYLGIMVVDGVPHVLEINTRIGDPEIQSIGETVVNFTEMLVATGQNKPIPDAIYTATEAVTVKLMNTNYGSKEYKEPADSLGSNEVKLCRPENISLTYGTLHASAKTHQIAASKIYAHLQGKDLGSYRYRTDIGFLT